MRPTEASTSFVAECFWPDVTEQDLAELDERIRSRVAALEPGRIRYLGSWLIRRDEVVLCRFEGTDAAVRRVATEAGVPFERILETAESPWALPRNPT
jgi:hypothetical protein